MPFFDKNDELRETLVEVEAVLFELELLEPVSSLDELEPELDLEEPEVDEADEAEELDVLVDVALHALFLSLDDLLVCGFRWCRLCCVGAFRPP